MAKKMSDYIRPAKMIIKLTSAKGRSVKYLASSPYGKMTFAKDIKGAIPLSRHEQSLVRCYLQDKYTITKIAPSTFEPGTMTFAQIMEAAKCAAS